MIANKETQKQRINLCKSCKSFLKKVNLCKECGCFMPVKVTFANVYCPLGKWKEETVLRENNGNS